MKKLNKELIERYKEIKETNIENLWGPDSRDFKANIHELLNDIQKWGYENDNNFISYIKSLINILIKIEKNVLKEKYLEW